MSASEFAVSTTLSVREVCLRLTVGLWDQTIIVVTTLLDAKRYSARQLTELYGLLASRRSEFAASQNDLKMEMLTAKTPKWYARSSGPICLPTPY